MGMGCVWDIEQVTKNVDTPADAIGRSQSKWGESDQSEFMVYCICVEGHTNLQTELLTLLAFSVTL